MRYVSGSTNAYLPLQVNGRHTLALIDTGIEMSLAPSSLVRSRDIVGSKQRLKAANGTEINVIGEAKLRCQASEYCFEVNCLVTEQLMEMILGLEWLESQHAQWHFTDRWIKINDFTFPLYSLPRAGKCRKVAAASDIKIPALCEMDIVAYAILPDLKNDHALWATQPQVLESGLMVAGTLLPERAVDLAIRVMNPTRNEIQVKKGLQCQVEEVELIEDVRSESHAATCVKVKEKPAGTSEAKTEAELFPNLCKLMGIDKLRTTAYKPSTNGLVERFHRTLNAPLGRVVNQRQRDWDQQLPLVMSAYRATEHESTGFSPSRLFLGREPILPIDLVLSDCQPVVSQIVNPNDYIADVDVYLKYAYSTVREFTKRVANARAARYDLRVRPKQFNPGSWVWLYYPRKHVGLKDKWTKFYCGPFRVLGQVGPVLYRIQKSARSLPKLVYVDKLKPFLGDPPRDWDLNPKVEVESPEMVGFENLDMMQNQADFSCSRPRREIRRPARFRNDV